MRMYAAAAAVAAGLLAATLSLLRPVWLFPIPSRDPPIPLPETYASGKIFDAASIDTEPVREQLGDILRAFSTHIREQARDFGLTSEQCTDLGSAAAERLRAMLDPDIERDYTAAAQRGLISLKSDMVARIQKHPRQLRRLNLASFGLSSSIVVPQNRRGGKSYQQLSSVQRIGTINYRLLPDPTYDNSGIHRESERMEVLFPLRVPVLDLGKKEFTSSPSAVVVFGFLFVWAESDTRHQWVPEKYSQYSHDDYFPRPNEQDRFAVVGYPMAF